MDPDPTLLSTLTDPGTDLVRLEALAEQHTEQSRARAVQAAELFATSANRDHSVAAFLYLRSSAELALSGGLGASVPEDPTRRAQRVNLLVDAETALRRRLAADLDALLEDRRPVPVHLGPPGEEAKPLPRRVCDVAYLGLVRLVRVGEELMEEILGEQAFLEQAEGTRDQLILRARQTRLWQRSLTAEPDPDAD